ncbi:MAG: cellulose binding domain-containing protein, partial [Halioglobus sp.]|nr:cellulose binding domain-containing protein [Halioglobus sp.]
MRHQEKQDHDFAEPFGKFERHAGIDASGYGKGNAARLPKVIASPDWRSITALSILAAVILTVWTVPSQGANDNQGAVSVAVDLFDDWGSGACGEGLVTNNGSASIEWEVNVDLPGSVTSYWSSEISHLGNSGIAESDTLQSWRVTGVAWNQTLAPGASTTFGFCFNREEASQNTSTDDPDMPMTGPHPHPVGDSEFIDLATFGLSNGSHHTGHDGLVGGRTAITTEALLAYNHLRAFVGLAPATINDVGAWAFANGLTNNTQAWGNDQMGVGLWYAMQGAKVGWMADAWFDPQAVADIERTARLGSTADVMAMVAAYGHEGYAQYLNDNGLAQTFINTLKMEPHYAGWMHDRAHGW